LIWVPRRDGIRVAGTSLPGSMRSSLGGAWFGSIAGGGSCRLLGQGRAGLRGQQHSEEGQAGRNVRGMMVTFVV
jgi:hypothetical protein